MEIDPAHLLLDAASLEAHYPPPIDRAVLKELDHIDEHCRAFIAASPFLVLGTQGPAPDGRADNSPRGDVRGFVQVADEHTLLIPDRPGNNRLDSLHNIIRNPRVGLLLLIPGVTDSLRVNGDAVLSRDPALLARFEVRGKLPRAVIVVQVREAYIHCAKALMRADLWNPSTFGRPESVASFGCILAAHTKGFVDGPALDADLKVRLPGILY